jgi:chemotaxis protein methyltransferase CheR
MMLTPDQFGTLSALVHRSSGIHLHAGKLGLVQSRLASRLRELDTWDVDAYLACLARPGGEAEVARLVDALTTNKTAFFREPQHFTLLRTLLPELQSTNRPLTIWSAGCSSGEEAYTLALVLADALGTDTDARILATDISARMLDRARSGVYAEEAVEPVHPLLRQRWFRCVQPRHPRSYEIAPEVRELVRFARLNLMDDWPMRGTFDLICCRNVMIYFDKATQQTLVQRLWEKLRPGGYLFTGHSESLAGMEHAFHYVRPAVYQRV